MDGGIDAHRYLVRIFVGNALVHVEKVAVALADGVLAEATNCVRKVEVDAESALAHAMAVIADRFCVARGYVARDEIAKAGIAALEVVIALGFWDLIWLTLVSLVFGGPA